MEREEAKARERDKVGEGKLVGWCFQLGLPRKNSGKNRRIRSIDSD